MANTTFSDRDLEGRKAGKAELDAVIKSTVNTVGGDRNEIIGALNSLLGSGALEKEEVYDLLPMLQKGAIASGSDVNELSAVAISAIKQMNVSVNEIPKLIDHMIAAGQSGNFEIKDMAAHLPSQFAYARQAGMQGLSDIDALLTFNQQARAVAGSGDEAGNNVINYLTKLSSRDLSNSMEKVDYVDKDGQTKGVKWIESLRQRQANGQNTLEASLDIFREIAKSNPEYRKLDEQLKTAPDAEKAAIYEKMKDLTMGGIFGQVMADRQALGGLLGGINAIEQKQKSDREIAAGDGQGEIGYQLVASTNDFKTEKLKNVSEFASMESIAGFNDVIGDISQKLTEYAAEYPELTKYISGAVTMVKTLSAAAIAAAASLYLLGGRGGGGLLSRGMRTAAPAAAAGGGAAAASQAGRGFLGALFDIAASPAARLTTGAALALTPNTTAEDDVRFKMSEDGTPLWRQKDEAGNVVYRATQPEIINKNKQSTDPDLIEQIRLGQQPQATAAPDVSALLSQIDHYTAAIQRQEELVSQLAARGEHESIAGVLPSIVAMQQAQAGLLEQLPRNAEGDVTVKDPLQTEQLRTLSAELAQRLDTSNTILSQLAAQPINVSTTTQLVVDGQILAEQVSRHQVAEMRRGGH